VSAAMLNFCSHSTTKNGLIQVFRLILIDKLLIHAPRLHK
jgi:hypothetical protein